MEYISLLLEAGISLGGGPIRGINFTARCKQIATELVPVLGGKPSEDITQATILSLYKIKPHLVRVIAEEDPMTGRGHTSNICL